MESSVDATDGLMLDEIPPSTPDAYQPSQTVPSPFPSVIEEDWERRRGFVIKEFITSEETYTKRLRLTLDLFVEPLRKHEILTTSEINTQFLNWELFVGLHQDLYENMVRDNDIGRLNLGERFKIFSHYLKAYSQYLTNYERARAERARLLTSNKRFYNFVEKVEASPESLQLPLESFLMEPVQRVPRYRMLFEQLLKFTPENHAEHEAVSDALRLTAEVSQSNADAIAQWEKKQRIMTIMMQLTPAKCCSSPSNTRRNSHPSGMSTSSIDSKLILHRWMANRLARIIRPRECIIASFDSTQIQSISQRNCV